MLRKFLVVLSLAALSLPGAVVYDNGGPNGASGNEMTEWIQAEDFTLGGATTITDVTFWDIEIPGGGAYQGSIEWRIYADAAGTPGAVLYSGTATPTRTAQGAGCCGLDRFQNDFSVGAIGLLAGTYYLGLHNGPLTTDFRAEFYWETTAGNGTPTGIEDHTPFDVGGWFANGQEHAFRLEGQRGIIPEPSTVALIGLGLCGLGLFRRRAAK